MRKKHGSKNKHKKNDHNSEITADYLIGKEYKDDSNDIAVDAASYQFGDMRKRTSKRKRKTIKNVVLKRRTSRKKSFGHSFGTSSPNFKRFIIIFILMAIRSLVKNKSASVGEDIKNIQYGALNFLTISSLLELVEHLFGAKVRNNVTLGYLMVSIGLDMSELV